MPAYFSPIGNEPQTDANGDPIVGGKIWTYQAGTTTPAVTYTDSDGLTPQANPIILNSSGLPASPIWLTGGIAYKFVFTDANDVQTRPTVDDITGINDPTASGALDEWTLYTATPSYVSATSFSVVGDQTNIFQQGRRVRTVNTGGTVYSTVANASFAAGVTTVTVLNDSGSLDVGLSQVSYGLITATDSSLPKIVSSFSAVSGLSGTINAGSPTTIYDLSAHAITVKNAVGATMSRYATGTISCNISTAGPIANGRDQAAAFSNSSWVYLYFIWNGSTVATLASATAPASFTGATLPTGYTHWAFASALRLDVVGAIVASTTRGSSVFFNANQPVITNGVQVVETAVSLTATVPPVASRIYLQARLSNNTAGVGVFGGAISFASGAIAVKLWIGVDSASGPGQDTQSFIFPNVSQNIYYINDTGNIGMNIAVSGYILPNGDS